MIRLKIIVIIVKTGGVGSKRDVTDVYVVYILKTYFFTGSLHAGLGNTAALQIAKP